MRGWILLAAAGVCSACYSPRPATCTVQCGAGDSCPGDLVCLSDGYCHVSADEIAGCGIIDAGSGDGGLPPGEFRSIAAGWNHSCGVDTDGAMWCWGENRVGQLGNEVAERSGEPMRVGVASDWTEVDCGSFYACGLRDGGRLFCWGSNSLFQIGDPEQTLTGAIPIPAEVLPGTAFKAFSTGGEFACAIAAADDKLYCWGGNIQGELASGTPGTPPNPMATPIVNGDAPANTWRSVSAGGSHACAIHTSGQLYCWGEGATGRLGDGEPAMATAAPSAVALPAGETEWSAVAAGQRHTCAIGGTGKLYCWGDNSSGEIGTGGANQENTPLLVPGGMTFTAVDAGFINTCAVTMSGAVRCTGANDAGQLGTGDWRSGSPAFVQVSGLADMTRVTVGQGHACALGADGSARCWGVNAHGQLGEGTVANGFVPRRVGTGTWTQVSAGARHVCAVDSQQAAWCWGLNENAQLGAPVSAIGVQSAVPSQVPLGSGAVLSVAAGGFHSCARVDDVNDEVRCWGLNSEGQVGHGSPDERPPGLALAMDSSQIDTGSFSTCAIVGTARYCWGSTDLHQLGTGSTSLIPNAMAINDMKVWGMVSIGRAVGCGLETSGVLLCWGDRARGAVGDGMFNGFATTPAIITGGWSMVAVSPGEGHACGVNGGALQCWGGNGSGQLGNNMSGMDFATPQAVTGPLAATWALADCGGDHSCGLHKSNLADPVGEIYCFGDNSHGQLGDGTVELQQQPNMPVVGGPWKSFSLGFNFGCAIHQDDSLWCWGENLTGVMGDGTGARLTPVAVVLPQ